MSEKQHWSMTMTLQWRLRSPATRRSVKLFVEVNINEIIKVPLIGHWEGEPLVTGGFAPQRASNAEIIPMTGLHNGYRWKTPYECSNDITATTTTAAKFKSDFNDNMLLKIWEISITVKCSLTIPIPDLSYWPTGIFTLNVSLPNLYWIMPNALVTIDIYVY